MATTATDDDGDDSSRIRIPKSAHAILVALADRHGCSISEVAVAAILAFRDHSDDPFKVESAALMREMEALNTSNEALSLATFALAEALVDERAEEGLRLASVCEVLSQKVAELQSKTGGNR